MKQARKKWGWEWWGEGKEEKTRPDPVVQPYYGIRILSNKNNNKKKNPNSMQNRDEYQIHCAK